MNEIHSNISIRNIPPARYSLPDRVVGVVARRYRLSIAHARVVASLAGLGCEVRR